MSNNTDHNSNHNSLSLSRLVARSFYHVFTITSSFSHVSVNRTYVWQFEYHENTTSIRLQRYTVKEVSNLTYVDHSEELLIALMIPPFLELTPFHCCIFFTFPLLLNPSSIIIRFNYAKNRRGIYRWDQESGYTTNFELFENYTLSDVD